MGTPWNLTTDKDLPAHLLQAPRGWLRSQGEAAARRACWAPFRNKNGDTKREDLRGLHDVDSIGTGLLWRTRKHKGFFALRVPEPEDHQ